MKRFKQIFCNHYWSELFISDDFEDLDKDVAKRYCYKCSKIEKYY